MKCVFRSLAFLSLIAIGTSFAAELPPDWKKARDAQDRAALDRIAQQASQTASSKPNDADAQYRAALAESLKSEVAMEVRDKGAAASAAQNGIQHAQKAVALNGNSSEYHRVLGTLCGQVVPANVLLGMKWGRCALDEVKQAIKLDPNSSMAYLSSGVGNYYLPPSFGGGPELAVKDFEKAIQLNPKNDDAHVWLGVALRKLNRNADARKALEKALALNPNRVWAKQQLEKTPAK